MSLPNDAMVVFTVQCSIFIVFLTLSSDGQTKFPWFFKRMFPKSYSRITIPPMLTPSISSDVSDWNDVSSRKWHEVRLDPLKLFFLPQSNNCSLVSHVPRDGENKKIKASVSQNSNANGVDHTNRNLRGFTGCPDIRQSLRKQRTKWFFASWLQNSLNEWPKWEVQIKMQKSGGFKLWLEQYKGCTSAVAERHWLHLLY